MLGCGELLSGNKRCRRAAISPLPCGLAESTDRLSSVVDLLAQAPFFPSLAYAGASSAHRQSGRYNIGALKTFAAEPQISTCLEPRLLNYIIF